MIQAIVESAPGDGTFHDTGLAYVIDEALDDAAVEQQASSSQPFGGSVFDFELEFDNGTTQWTDSRNCALG